MLDGSVCACVQECPFDLFGWVFLVHVGMYRSFCMTGIGTIFGWVVSSYAGDGSCFLYFTVMALFSNSPPNDDSV